ncbi:MAG: hypothetical protein FJ149_07785, partial [Euryarchaeota archaeon]|nr:hypothetical protein [Euryarchaeota archaeon]
MNKLSWLLAGLAIATAAFVLVLLSPGAQAWQSGDTYSGSGDWTINNPTVVGDEWYVVVTGNIQVRSTLTIYNSGILVDETSNGQYTVNVAAGGTLRLYDSWLGSYDSYHYKFTVYGSLHVNSSDVSDMWGDTASWVGGIQLYSGSSATIEWSYIYRGMTGGIYIDTCSPTIRNNYIYYNGIDGGSTTYCYGIYARSDGTTSAGITYNEIFGNYYVSAGTNYGTGIRSEYQARNDVISYNYIYDNGFSTTTTPAGCQIYLNYSGPSLSNNYLANGRYQLYAVFSSPPSITGGYMYTNVRGTTCYHVYAVNSSITLDGIYFSYTAFTNQFYGIYATSSSMLTVKDCDFYYTVLGTQTRYNVYASTYTSVDIVDCTFMNTYGSTYYGVYATSYCPVNITGSTFNATSTTGANPGFVYVSSYCNVSIKTSTFEATGTWGGTNFFYGSSYCHWTVSQCRINIWLLNPTSSFTFYGFQLRTFVALGLDRTTFNFNTMSLASTSSPTFYPIYVYNTQATGYGIYSMDNTTVNINWPSNWPMSSGSYYGIYTYRTPTYINWSKFYSLNEPLGGTSYGLYCYQQSCDISNSTLEFSKIRGSGGYGYYIFSGANLNYYLNISDSTFIANYNIPGNIRSTASNQGYNYYNHLFVYNSKIVIIGTYQAQFYNYGYGGNRNAVVINSELTMRCTVESQYYMYQYAYFYLFYYTNIYLDRVTVNLESSFYCYNYLYGQSGQNNYLIVQNCTFNIDNYKMGYYQYSYCYMYHYYYKNILIEHTKYNVEFGYYLYYLLGYSPNTTLRWNTYNYTQIAYGMYGTQGYLAYITGSLSSDQTYLALVENCTYRYDSYGASTMYPYMFYIYNHRAIVRDCDITVRNHNGTIPVMIAYVYYGAKLDMVNVSLDAEFGTDSPGGGMPGFNLVYIYNYGTSYPPCTFNLTDSVWKVKLATDTFLHNGFYIYGTNDEVNIIRSEVRWDIAAPASTLRVFRFYDDPSAPGKLNRLDLSGSDIKVDVSGPDAQVFILKMGAGAYIGKTVVTGANIVADFRTESSMPISLVEVSGVRELTLADLALSMKVPTGSSMVINGVRLERSEATVANMTITGNGQGRMTGILYDLASRGLITNVTIKDCWAGISSLFFSEPTISGVRISGATYGIFVNGSGNGTLTGENTIEAPTTLRLIDESWLNIVDTALPAAATTQMELDSVSTAWCLNATFDGDKVVFKDQNSILIVNQWLRITVLWMSADQVPSTRPVPGVRVTLQNALGDEYLRAVADDLGVVPWFTAAEYTRNATKTTTYTPYKVSLDQNGFTGESSVKVVNTTDATLYLVDGQAPVVEITTPEDGRIQNHRDVLVAGRASDPGSGLDTISVSLDGTTWERVRLAGLWAHLLENIPDGEYTLRVRVTDIAGNSAETSVRVTIDLVPPEIIVTSPADRSLGNRIGVDLVGTVEKGSVLTVNRRPAVVREDGSFSFGVRLVEGRNEFSLHAVDRAGNQNSLTWTLLLDITPPPLVLTGPA